MKRTVLLLSCLFFPAFVSAQTSTLAPPVSFNVDIYTIAAPSETATPLARRNTAVGPSLINCNVNPVPSVALNPTAVGVEDPFHVGKICILELPPLTPNEAYYAFIRPLAQSCNQTPTSIDTVSPCAGPRTLVTPSPFAMRLITLPPAPFSGTLISHP